MPKSDTWPGGTGFEAMPGIDSSGSCDSVLSANSGFSDDSLEHLSAEEKACLMFLEETIDSLDTEEDSGLSNDETEQKPSLGNVASKQAKLSASMSRSTASYEQSKQPVKKDNKADKNPIPSYLVPTPFVVANSGSPAVVTKPSALLKKNPCPINPFSPSTKDVGPKPLQSAECPPVPLEINAVITPSTKTQKHSGKAVDSSLQRGPLSYDALVYLRKNASEKKTPLCPTVDHTINSIIQHSSTTLDNGPLQNNIPRFDRFHPEFSQSRTIPPAVPPKPKNISENTSAKTQNQTAIGSSRSFSVKRTPNPEVVRQEALHKLGLLKETSNETSLQASTPKIQNGLEPAPNIYVKTPPNNNPTRNPSFCVTRLPAEPKNRGLHSSASFHQPSRHSQASASRPVQANRHRTQSNHRNMPQRLVTPEPVKGPNEAHSSPPKNPNAVGYSVMVVPGMGADRREALRKLGLLKE